MQFVNFEVVKLPNDVYHVCVFIPYLSRNVFSKDYRSCVWYFNLKKKITYKKLSSLSEFLVNILYVIDIVIVRVKINKFSEELIFYITHIINQMM